MQLLATWIIHLAAGLLAILVLYAVVLGRSLIPDSRYFGGFCLVFPALFLCGYVQAQDYGNQPQPGRFFSLDPTKRHVFWVPPNTYRLYFSLSGGGGGYGGNDGGPFNKPETPGSFGAQGGFGAVLATVVKVKPGQMLELYVGAGGKNAKDATPENPFPPGGEGGKSAEGLWRGGNAGPIGPDGFSGKGGGGGGASYMVMDGKVMLVASGGGGGQGGAYMAETHEVGWGGNTSMLWAVSGKEGCQISSGGDGKEYTDLFVGRDASGGGGGGMGAPGGSGGRGHADGSTYLPGSAASGGSSCYVAPFDDYFETPEFLQGGPDQMILGYANNNGKEGSRVGSIEILPVWSKINIGIISKASVDKFKVSISGGWADPIDVQTTMPGVVEFLKKPLETGINVSRTMQIDLPTGWQMDSVSCVDNNRAVTQNPEQFKVKILGKNRWEIAAANLRSAAILECRVNVSLQKMQINARLMAEPKVGQFIKPFFDTAMKLDDCEGEMRKEVHTDQDGRFYFADEVLHAGSNRCIQQNLPPGWKVNEVSCVDRAIDQSGNQKFIIHPPAVASNRWRLEAAFAKPGSVWECIVYARYLGFQISGQVLHDNGRGPGGVAHDGILNGSETGRAGVDLSLDNCAGKPYAAKLQSLADGLFSFHTEQIDGGPVCVRQSLPAELQSVSFHGGSANAVYRKDEQGQDELRFEWQANTNYDGLIFGHIEPSLLVSSGQQVVAAGMSASYAHIYTAATSAKLGFSSPDADPGQSDKMPGWHRALLLDENCNTRQDAEDKALDSAALLDVKAGDRVCLLQRIQSPATALPAQRYFSQLLVNEMITPQPATGLKQIVRELRADNLTEISNAGESLKLTKQVRQVEACPSTAADRNEFTTSNEILPGSYVEYLLSYRNVSGQVLHNLVISDSVPAYTLFKHASCDALPVPGLTECQVNAPLLNETEKSISWKLIDATVSQAGDPQGLQPGAAGTVRYCVQIER